MSNSSNTAQVSRRYARALFELVQEGSSLRDDLAAVAAVASADEVAEFLASPEYPAALKQGVLLKAVGKISQEAKRLVEIKKITEKDSKRKVVDVTEESDEEPEVTTKSVRKSRKKAGKKNK